MMHFVSCREESATTFCSNVVPVAAAACVVAVAVSLLLYDSCFDKEYTSAIFESLLLIVVIVIVTTLCLFPFNHHHGSKMSVDAVVLIHD